jgi:flagellar hook-length control protein FliK
LEASVIPHIETVLRQFGLDAQETGKLLNESRTNGGQLDLEMLSQRLKAYLEMNPEKASAEIKQETPGDDNGLLRRIGITAEGEKVKGPISLETFVQQLKEKVAQLRPHALSDTQMDKQVKGLLNHVFVKEKGEHTKQDGLADRGNTPELQTFFQKKGPDAVTEPKSTNPDRNAENSRLAAWKFAQVSKESSESKTVSGENNRFETADLFKHLSDAKPERWMEIREKFIPKNQGEDKSPDTAHLRGGLFTRTLNSVQVARPATESVPVHVVNQVGRRISLALKNGQNHVKIQLKPPDLGSIQLEMSMKDNILKVAMIAEHHSVKDMLMSHVSDLKQSLLQQGIELQKVDVEIDYDFGQSMANAQKNLTGGRSGKRGAASDKQSADPEEGTESLDPLRNRSREDHTVLDLFA